MWVKCMQMCFLELAVRKTSDCYLKLSQEQTPVKSHFSWILIPDSQIKEKFVKLQNISLNVVVKNNWQRVALLFLIL